MKKGLGIEAIKFQNPLFFKALTAVIEDYRGSKIKSSIKEFETKITAIIKHHSNSAFTVTCGNKMPCIRLPALSNIHLFWADVDRKHIKEWNPELLKNYVRKGKTRFSGGVDLNTGCLTGEFAKIECEIHLPQIMMSTNHFTSEELAAIMLHEVGHGFTFFELFTKMVQTNQVIASLTEALTGLDDVGLRRVYIEVVCDEFGIQDIDAAKLAHSNSVDHVGAVVLGGIVERIPTYDGMRFYDINTSEQLADQFAVRMGAAQHLASGLHRLGEMFDSSESEWFGTYLFRETIIGLASLMFLPVTMLTLIMMSGEDSHRNLGDPSYDRPLGRIVRIRQDVINKLKNPDTNPQDARDTQKELEVIEGIMAKMNDRLSFYQTLSRLLHSNSRRRYGEEKLARELESLANNDLYLMASKLKHL